MNEENSSVKLGEAPTEPLKAGVIYSVIKQALKTKMAAEGKSEMDDAVATGPEIIKAVLEYEPGYANDIIWSLANVGVNLLLKGAGNKPEVIQ